MWWQQSNLNQDNENCQLLVGWLDVTVAARRLHGFTQKDCKSAQADGALSTFVQVPFAFCLIGELTASTRH